MFRWITSVFGRRVPDPAVQRVREAELQLRERELSTRKRLLESTLFAFDNLVDPREPLYDAGGEWFSPLGAGENLPPNLDSRKRGEVLPIYLNEYGLKVVRDQSRKQLAFNEFAINAVENRVSYIVGTGFQYKVVLKDDPETPADESDRPDGLCRQAQAVLDEFRAKSDWGEMEQEIVSRVDRDGEAFLRWFHDAATGIPSVRIVEPEHVKSPNGGVTAADSFGVQTDEEDVEKVTGYWIVQCPEKSTFPELTEAREILHIKLNVNRNAKRGLPTLFPVRKNLDRAEKLLRNMSILAQTQATFALIRKHTMFSASSVSAFQGAQADVQYTAPITGKNANFQQYMPGSVVDVPEGIDYEFPAAAVEASQYVEILQAELRAVASRLVMPEYMLTSDASNANFASTQVAESPSVKNFERLQDFYARKFGRGPFRAGPHCGAMWRVLAGAVVAGRLPVEVLRRCELQVEGPSLIVRDKPHETNRWKVLADAGILSQQTWATHEGLDFDQEQRRGARSPAAAQPAESPDENGAADDWLTEAVEPNKSGHGCHDSETGHPAPCGGGSKTQKVHERQQAIVDHADKQSKGILAKLSKGEIDHQAAWKEIEGLTDSLEKNVKANFRKKLATYREKLVAEKGKDALKGEKWKGLAELFKEHEKAALDLIDEHKDVLDTIVTDHYHGGGFPSDARDNLGQSIEDMTRAIDAFVDAQSSWAGKSKSGKQEASVTPDAVADAVKDLAKGDKAGLVHLADVRDKFPGVQRGKLDAAIKDAIVTRKLTGSREEGREGSDQRKRSARIELPGDDHIGYLALRSEEAREDARPVETVDLVETQPAAEPQTQTTDIPLDHWREKRIEHDGTGRISRILERIVPDDGTAI